MEWFIFLPKLVILGVAAYLFVKYLRSKKNEEIL